MIFRMYCTCGAGGSMREVSATRKIHCPPVRSYGDMRAKPEPVNVCSRCGKVWPALAPRGALRKLAKFVQDDQQVG